MSEALEQILDVPLARYYSQECICDAIKQARTGTVKEAAALVRSLGNSPMVNKEFAAQSVERLGAGNTAPGPDVDGLLQAGNKMADFIREWRDCLEGVQMAEDDFVASCGLGDWNKASAEGRG